jgi:hypothetical protein
MRKTGVFLGLLLSAGLSVGCEDGGPSNLALADLVGSWVADEFKFTNQANLAESFDLVAAGADVTMTIAGNGRYSVAAVVPVGGVADMITGALLVEEGVLLITDDESPGATDAFGVDLSGGMLTIFSDEVEYDFDEPADGIDEPADLRAVFRLATGTTVADLVGTWEATEFRFVSSPLPTDTIDAIAEGGGFSVTLAADGRYSLALTMPGELPEDRNGVLIVSGDMLYMIDVAQPEEFTAFEFGLDGETITLRGEDSIDFDDPPDSVNDPAVVEMVLARQ